MKTTEVLLETIEQHGRTILAHKPKPWDSKNPAVAHWLRLHGLSARVAAQIDVDNAQAERLMGELESELAWAHWIP